MTETAYSYAKLEKGILNLRLNLRKDGRTFQSIKWVSDNADEKFLEKQKKSSKSSSKNKQMMQKQQKENSL